MTRVPDEAHEGTSRRRVAINLASNQIGFILPAIVTFFLSPFVVHSLGDGLYGLWSLVVSFTGHYGLLTVGVQSAATRYVAHAAGKRDPEAMNRFVNGGLALLVPAGIVTAIVGCVLALFLGPLFRIPAAELSAAQLACVLLALTAGVTFATAIFSSILTAHQRFDSLNLVKTSSILVRSLFTVWLLLSGHGIVALAVLALAMATLSGVGFAGLARIQCPGWRLGKAHVEAGSVKTLVGFGGKSLVGTASLTLAYQSDLFVIGLFLSPEHITIYSLGSTLLFYVIQFVNSIVHVLDPYATQRFAREGVAGVRDLFVEGSAFLYALGGIIVGGAIAFARPFFSVWISPEHEASGTILAILVIPQFFNMGARFGHSVLVGMARIGTFNTVSLIGGVANVLLSFALIRVWGLPGVAIATLIPMVLVDGVWFVPWISRLLGVSAWRIYMGSMAPGAILAIVAGVVGFGIQELVPARGWGSLGLGVGITGFVSVGAAWLLLPARLGGLDWRAEVFRRIRGLRTPKGAESTGS